MKSISPKIISDLLPEAAPDLREDMAQITSACSHEIKDPVREALVILDEIGSSLPEYGERLTTLKNWLKLDIARVNVLHEYAYLSQNPGGLMDFDTEQALHAAAKEHKALIQSTGAKITHEKLPTLHCRPQQMQKLFSELVKNALVYNDSIPPMLHIRALQDGAHWRFCFEDNGLGVEEEYQHIIFALFRRADALPDSEHHGAGLAFCKRIIENHNGHIWAESIPGEGTKIWFTI